MTQPSADWPIWITAGATALTAVLTGTGGFAAWLALNRERQREMPVVERSFTWKDDHLHLSLTVRNRLAETLVLDSIQIAFPRRSTVSSQHGKITDSYGNPGPPVPGERPLLECRHEVNAYGASRSNHSAGDTAYWSFALWPPAGWTGGRVVVVLRLSSKAETIRSRRIVIKGRVPTDPKTLDGDRAKAA